jgi:excisionase family DNA binding protein
MRTAAHSLSRETAEKQAESWLQAVLASVAETMVASVSKVITTQMKRNASAAEVSKAVKNSLPQLLRDGFQSGLLIDEEESRKRRARLMQLLASVDAKDFGVDLPVSGPGAPGARDGDGDGEDELTSEAASKLLHVSRTHLNTLLDSGALPSSRTAGGHRRVSKAAVLAYREQMKVRQSAGLDAMMEASRRLGLYHNDLDGIPRRAKR